MERLQSEFSAIKLWEAGDRDAVLKAAAPRVRALAHFGHSKVDGKLMDALPKLEIVSNFGVGVDQIDLAAAKKRSIIVTNTPDVLNDCVADCALSLILNTLRKFPQSEAYLRSGSGRRAGRTARLRWAAKPWGSWDSGHRRGDRQTQALGFGRRSAITTATENVPYPMTPISSRWRRTPTCW
jgi:lactate dehydrogenase-like 2-hydroxyacid dehydrogenase